MPHLIEATFPRVDAKFALALALRSLRRTTSQVCSDEITVWQRENDLAAH